MRRADGITRSRDRRENSGSRVGTAHRPGRREPASEAVAEVVYSAPALETLARALEFLYAENPPAAVAALDAVESAVVNLAAHPLLGARVEADLRELVISFGETGYIALYRFVVQQDEVRVLALRHQREIGYLP